MLVDVRSPQGVAVWKRSSVAHDDRGWHAHRLVADTVKQSLSLRPESSSQEAQADHSDSRQAAPHQSPTPTDPTLVLALQVRARPRLLGFGGRNEPLSRPSEHRSHVRICVPTAGERVYVRWRALRSAPETDPANGPIWVKSLSALRRGWCDWVYTQDITVVRWSAINFHSNPAVRPQSSPRMPMMLSPLGEDAQPTLQGGEASRRSTTVSPSAVALARGLSIC
jgi:hypothetical protein